MLVLTFLLCTLNPLVAHALPNAKEGTASCKVKTATVTHTVFLDPTTVIVPAVPSSSSSAAAAMSSSVGESATGIVHTPTVRPSMPSSVLFSNQTVMPSSTAFTNQTETISSFPASSSPSKPTVSVPAPLSSELPMVPSTVTSTADSSTKIATSTGNKKPVSSFTSTTAESSSTTSTSTSTPSSSSAASPNDLMSDATAIASSPEATSMCGNADRKIMPGFPWTVSNAMYNAGQMSGQQCTNYEEVVETSGGTQQMVRYESVTDIEQVDDTEDVCKGYSNVGIGENLRKPFRDVKAIPAYFQWERTISTAFKGANVFDIITSPTSGDGSSTASSEFMLWISIWGGQVPIGYSRGPVATFDLYGTSFDLYEGENPGSGVTVRSALPTSSFDGVFEGDLRDWLQVMADRGYVADGDYVNVGNAGTEVFYGSSEMKAVVAIEIQV